MADWVTFSMVSGHWYFCLAGLGRVNSWSEMNLLCAKLLMEGKDRAMGGIWWHGT